MLPARIIFTGKKNEVKELIIIFHVTVGKYRYIPQRVDSRMYQSKPKEVKFSQNIVFARGLKPTALMRLSEYYLYNIL